MCRADRSSLTVFIICQESCGSASFFNTKLRNIMFYCVIVDKDFFYTYQ